jgi:predicted peptidase
LTGFLIGGLVLVSIPALLTSPQTMRWFWYYLNPFYWPKWYAVNFWIIFAGLLAASLLKSHRTQATFRSFYALHFWQSVKTWLGMGRLNQIVIRFCLRRKSGKWLLRKYLRIWNSLKIEYYPLYSWLFTLAAVLTVVFTYSTFTTVLTAMWGALLTTWEAILALTATPRFHLWVYAIYFRDFIYHDIYQSFFVGPLIEFNASGEITWRLFLMPLTGILFVVWLLRLSSKSKKKKKVRRTLFILFMAFSCGGLQAEEVPRKIILLEEARQVSERDIRKASLSESEKNVDGGYNAHINVIDCFAAMSYRYTGGRYHNEEIRFRLRSPESLVPNKKYPLLVWLHGAGESGDDNKRQLAHMQATIEFLVGDNKVDFYLLATQCPADNQVWNNSISNEGKGDAPLTIMKEIFDILLEEYPIDRNRISFYGQCSGAHGAWSFLEKYPELVSAITAFSTIPPAGFVWDKRYRKTSFWAFNNLDDTGVPVDPMQKFVKQINDSGGLGYLTVRETGGHDTWTEALKKDKVVGWMILQDLQKGGPPAGAICSHRTVGEVFWLFGLPIGAILCVIPFYFRKRVAL